MRGMSVAITETLPAAPAPEPAASRPPNTPGQPRDLARRLTSTPNAHVCASRVQVRIEPGSAQIGGYRTPVISRPSQRVTVIARHRAVRDAETAQVAVTADQDAARAEKVTAVLIKRCRTVLTERCCYITK